MSVLKRFIITIFVFICFCVCSINAFAISKEELTPPEDFLIYSQNPDKVAQILKTDVSALENTVTEQNISFLAVNQDNTKQIKLTETQTDFSVAVGELSNLSDGSIEALLPDITGIEGIKGEIITKEKQKFVKTTTKMQGKNGYILTQYFTVTNKNLQTLNFYTDPKSDTDYVEQTFEAHPDSNTYIILAICILGTVIFGSVCIILIYTIIRDLVKSKKEV